LTLTTTSVAELPLSKELDPSIAVSAIACLLDHVVDEELPVTEEDGLEAVRKESSFIGSKFVSV